MLKKEDGIIDFEKNSETIYNHVRGMNPWPCAYTYINGKALKVFKTEIVNNFCSNENVPCGRILVADNKNGLIVKTLNGAIRLCQIQAEGGKRMKDVEYLLGHKIPLMEVLKNA